MKTLLCAACCLILPISSVAQTWNGGGANDNFSTPANWSGGSAPVNNGSATAALTGVTRTSPSLDTDYNLNILNISASGFTLGGTGALTLQSGLLKTTTSYMDFTASVPITLGGDVAIGGAGTTGSITLKGPISGNHGINFSGGTYAALYLDGSNTFTGNLNIDGGRVYLGANKTIASGSLANGVGIVLSNGGSFSVNRKGALTFDHVISGNGSTFGAFFVEGTTGDRTLTTVTLTNQSTYTGGTALGSATLVVGVANALPTSTALSFSSSSTLKLNADQTVGNTSAGTGSMLEVGAGTTFTANLTANSSMGATSGTGRVVLNGAYNLQTYDAWGHTGGTTLTDTNLLIGAGYSYGALAGDVVNNGKVTFNHSTPLTYAGAMSGTGVLKKLNTNTLTLTGDITVGTVEVDAGTLYIGNGGTSGSSSSNIALSSGTNLFFNRSDASSYTGAISGSGNVYKSGGGTLTLTQGNSFTGILNHSGGRLIAAATNALGNSQVTIASSRILEVSADQTIQSLTGGSGSTVQFNGGSTITLGSDSSTTIASSLTGTGHLVKSGAGAVSISGGGTLTGTISAGAGSLFASGTYGSAGLAVASGATFSAGAGTKVSGSATFSSLSIQGGSVLNFDLLNATGTAGTPFGWDLLTANGAVTLGGTADNPIKIAMQSISFPGTLGAVSNFDLNKDYSWNFITGAAVSGFDASGFVFDTTNFLAASNPGYTGTLSISQVGTSLYLNYTAATAVPEPATVACLTGLVALGIAAGRRKLRFAALKGHREH